MKRSVFLWPLVATLLTGCQSGFNSSRYCPEYGPKVVRYQTMYTTTQTTHCDSRQQAFLKATRVAVGETVTWRNGRTGSWGSYQPVMDGHSNFGAYCRQFAMNAQMNGNMERVYGTACRAPDGTWRGI